MLIRLESEAHLQLEHPGVPVEGDGGYLADAYMQAVKAVAERHSGDAGCLLGLVMAHELGHLMRGAGHSSDGVMSAVWSGKTMDQLRQRGLKFNRDDARRIRQDLRTRAVKLTDQPAH